ncbi:MAG: SDR family oxidoreductase [Curvibacter sp.]|nr:MAG: SDR family oxidoreductase [Curvibacter sp.]
MMLDTTMTNAAPSPACTLITGATSGIGLSIAQRLYPQRRLILHGRQTDKLDALRERFPDAEIWGCDLAQVDLLEASLETFLKGRSLRVQALVHCAGMAPIEAIKSVTLNKWMQVLHVNLTSALLISKSLSTFRLNAKNLESIVFISSNLSGFGAKGMAAYGASKAGLDGLMKSLAMELAPRVRVNSVLPGAIRTPMTENILGQGDLAERMSRSYPLGLGEVADIAEAVAFLLSDSSRWMTGQQMTVDGGRSCNLSA